MRRLWEYIKSWFRIRTEAIKDPEVELEQAITAARKRDQELRNQAARVIAHRTRLEQEIEQAAEDSAEAKEMAKQALLKSDSAQPGAGARASNGDDAGPIDARGQPELVRGG